MRRRQEDQLGQRTPDRRAREPGSQQPRDRSLACASVLHL